MDLKGQTILVTGSSSGIGRAIAVECAKKEAVVLVHFHKNEAGAKVTLEEVEKYSQGQIYQADLTREEEVRKLFSEISKDHNFLDLLVNNAGNCQAGQLDDLELWQFSFANIFFSSVYTTLEFLKTKGSANLRKIVNIGSGYAINEMSPADYPHYSAAKAALHNFTCSLARKLAPNVLVNAIAPGYTMTPAWDTTPKEEIEQCANLNLIKRLIRPEEIATMVSEILQNDAMTGEIIRVDGGLHLQNII